MRSMTLADDNRHTRKFRVRKLHKANHINEESKEATALDRKRQGKTNDQSNSEVKDKP